MNIKAKITLIIGAIITFILGWVILVMSLMNNGNAKTDLIQNQPIKKEKNKNPNNQQNQAKSGENNSTKKNSNTVLSNQDQPKKDTINKIDHQITILSYKNLISSKAWKLFSNKYKKLTDGKINIQTYEDLEKYYKEIIYLLATNDTSFDMAIIPAYWYHDIKSLEKGSFKLNNNSLQLSSIFDYNFEKYVKNNSIKAIPFAIEPIVGFTFNKEMSIKQDFNSWKSIIINNPNRLGNNGKIQIMPILLGYDKPYIKILSKTKKSYFPVFDLILRYYIFKKSETGAKILKEFGENLVYKTFDLRLYYILGRKYRKYSFCKNNMKYCILAGKKSNLVYGFSSDISFFEKNRLNLFKKFKVNTKKLRIITLATANKFAEYPVRNWIIIINPNSKNIQYLGNFLKVYIKLGQEQKLPFYKNLISPFLSNKLNSKYLKYFNAYKGKFISLDNMQISKKEILTEKILNFLQGKIGVNILLTK